MPDMTSDEPVPFATLLKEYRRAAGLTQEQLAERAHLSLRAVSALEQGQNHVPRTDTVTLLAGALALTADMRTRFTVAARAPVEREQLRMSNADHRAESAHPHNLPLELSSFIGREQQWLGVRQLLQCEPARGGYRLVTLTGAGGSGKTRLALRVAADLIPDYADGVWLVELASLLDPALLPEAVASVVGVREQHVRPLRESIVDGLRAKRMLIVLDNCEHLVTACAELVTTLLQYCPGLRVLATSRERLYIPGEVTWHVPTLAVPDQGELPSLEEFLRCEAVLLFADRARAVLPTFLLRDQDMPTVAQICRQLDGMPLALELAAAWTSVLSVQQIATRLEDCFRLLTGGPRAGVGRQRTLKATMDWSYALLSPSEQTLFARLSVFIGGFDLGAAEAVCPDQVLPESAILQVLGGLMDKSLVQFERQQGAPRYRLLEPVRQYAAQVLERSGDPAAMRCRHRDWCLRLAERAETQLWTEEQQGWLERLQRDHDNLRAALEWCVTAEGEAEMGLRLARALWQFWLLRGHYSDGRYWLESLLNVAPPNAPQRAEVFLHACALAARRDASAAGDLADQGISAYLVHHDQRGLVKALHLRGMIAWLQFDYQRARSLFEDALARAVAAELSAEAALLTHSVGFMCWWQADLRQARVLMETSLQQVQALGSDASLAASFLHLGWLPVDDDALAPTEMTIESSLLLLRQFSAPAIAAHIVANLGNLARCEHDHEQALRLLTESLRQFKQLGDRVGEAQVLGQLGNLARVQGDYGLARDQLADCVALRREIGESRGIAHAMVSLGNLSLAEGEPRRAVAQIEEGLMAVRQIQDKPAIAWTAASCASLALRAGDMAAAQRRYRDLVALYCSYGADRQGQALAMAGLGMIAAREQDYGSARSCTEASLDSWRQVGDRRSCAALSFQLGCVASLAGDPGLAGSRFAESLTHYQALGDVRGVTHVQAAMANSPRRSIRTAL